MEKEIQIGEAQKQIEEAFVKQYSEAIMNPSKTLDGHIANENNVTNDYRGRVLYEFFQNAVDRAESEIWIIMDSDSGTLAFANDGKPFSIEKTGNRKYSDFESLCSINTSSKNQNESIGNKGVGFKSCWEFTKRTSIISFHNGAPWGFELQRPCSSAQVGRFSGSNVEDWLLQKDIAEVVKKHGGTLPSFYFPRKLNTEETESIQTNIQGKNISTIITLHDITPENCTRLKSKIEEFARHEFFFVKQLKNLCQKDFRIHIIVDNCNEKLITTQADTAKWLDGNVVVKNNFTKEEIEELQDLSRSLNYEVKEPSVAIAFPMFDHGDKQLDARFYTYLPTEVRCGFNVLIHADFLLDVSRKNIDFADNKYNKRLLEHVAGLLVKVLQTRTELHQLEHFAKFLMPQNSEDALAMLVWDKLTSEGLLTEMLRSAYKGESSERACQLVFSAIDKWIIKHREREVWSEYYDRVYEETLKYFCDPEVKIVYVDEGDISSLPPSPPKPRNDAEEKKKLFYIAKDSDAQRLSLLRGIESITLSGMEELSKPELLKNRIVLENSNIEILRALSSESESAESVDIRRSIIRFIVGRQKSFDGYLNITHFSPQGNNPKEGHFLARILLPCQNEKWKPASKCYFGLDEKIKRYLDPDRFFEVNLDAFRALLEGTEFILEDVLRFFGATNRLPIDKVTSSNKIELSMPWQTTPQIEDDGMKKLINDSMMDWTGLDKIEVIYAQLRETAWFYDEKHKNFCKPAEVFLFNDDVVRPAVGQEKKNPDLQLLYQNLGIKPVDETTDNEKLLNQHEKLRNDEGQICKLHKTLYKQIALRLSRNKAENDQNVKQRLRELPLLCEQGYVEGDVWFVGRDSKKFKHHFSGINFLLFDDEVAKTFISALGRVKNFDPDFKPQPEEKLINSTITHPDQTTKLKQLIERNYLAEMFAIADEALPINRFVKEQALCRWQNLIIWYAEDVWIEAVLNGEASRIGFEQKDSDVFFLPISESERTKHPERIGQLTHDLEEPAKNEDFSKFGEAIANGVFRDVNLGPVLRSFLTEATKGGDNRENFLCERGIAQSDVSEMHSFIRESLLTLEERNSLIEQLREFFDLDSVDDSNWNNLETYVGCNKSFSDLEKSLSDERLKSVISQLNPTVRNTQKLREHKKYIQLCYFLDVGKELSDDNFFSQVESKENAGCFNRFDFSVESAMTILFNIEKTSATDMEMLEAQALLEIGNLPSLNLDPKVSGVEPVKHRLMGKSGYSSNQTKVVTLSAASREKQAKEQAQRGIAAERLLCINNAYSVIENNLQDSLKNKVIELYAGSDFAEGYLQKVKSSGESLEEIINILHVSKSMGDGLGYDILEPVINKDSIQNIHLVEVKASQSGATIYLSHNEFSKILGFANGKENNWRLYHVMISEQQTFNRTLEVKKAVREFYDKVGGAVDALAIVPDTWKIEF